MRPQMGRMKSPEATQHSSHRRYTATHPARNDLDQVTVNTAEAQPPTSHRHSQCFKKKKKHQSMRTRTCHLRPQRRKKGLNATTSTTLPPSAYQSSSRTSVSRKSVRFFVVHKVSDWVCVATKKGKSIGLVEGASQKISILFSWLRKGFRKKRVQIVLGSSQKKCQNGVRWFTNGFSFFAVSDGFLWF